MFLKSKCGWNGIEKIKSIDQPIGKQYSYGHGTDSSSDEEKKERQMNHLK